MSADATAAPDVTHNAAVGVTPSQTSVDASPVGRLRQSVETVLYGKPEVVRLALTALVGEGHLLIEDAPGLGKTSLAKAIALASGCGFTRVQCTPDMLPSDIVGTSVFKPSDGVFEFRRGPVFTNVLLVDEINRTTPRTQSALLEAMSEQQVSVDGATHRLERPFFVLATQNPFEFEGTYPLPENQLDRFMLRIEVGYPPREFERQIIDAHRTSEPVDRVKPVLQTRDILALQAAARDVRLDESLGDYLLDIVHGTREHPDLSLGVSPRGALTYVRAVKALAVVDGRDYVIPDDIKELAVPCLAHRVLVRGVMREGQRDRAVAALTQVLDGLVVPN